jgi:uncharacterized membrane protein (DUF2068 family)
VGGPIHIIVDAFRSAGSVLEVMSIVAHGPDRPKMHLTRLAELLPLVEMNHKDTGLLRLIAVFKFVKVCWLIAAGIAALRLVHADVGTVLERWVLKLGFDPGSALLNHAIQRVCEIPQDQVWELGAVSFIYAALFMTEGVGLWLAKHWAEWFTVIITGSLIPFEIYEMVRKPDALRILVFVVNIAVVAYLIRRIIRERRSENGQSARAGAGPSGARAASDSA